MGAKERKIETKVAARRRRKGTVVVWIVLGLLLFTGAAMAFFLSLAHDVGAGLRPDTPSDGVGRTACVSDVPVYAAGEGSVKEGTALRVFSENDDPLPAWWDPESAEIVYQVPIARTTHSDALDYNLNTTLWGWDGHGMEIWELDLMSRIFYLEFWGASDLCCEAGCDAILRLWETEEFGKSIGELLTAVNAAGHYVYDVYAYVWDVQYNQDGLAWCKQLCLERFVNGPVWTATYFQKWGYPDWGAWSPIPCYEIDGIYFSVSRWGV